MSTYLFCIIAVSFYGSVKGASSYGATPITGNYRTVRRSCRNNGGDLATFDSHGDVLQIYDLCAATDTSGNGAPTGGGCYVGFNDIQVLNDWRWVDGTPFTGQYWLDPTGLETSADDRCGAVTVSSSDSWSDHYYSMEDFRCDNAPIYGICEYPVAICDCYSLDLLSSSTETNSRTGALNSCYRYRLNACDDIGTVRIGTNDANTECGFRLADAFIGITDNPRARGISWDVISGPGTAAADRGILIRGLEDNMVFTLCFDESMVRGTITDGEVEYTDNDGADSGVCLEELPDFCPRRRRRPPSSASSAAAAGISGDDGGMFMVDMKGKNTVDSVYREPISVMTYVSAAIISCIVSIAVVWSAYILCIKPSNKTVYDKLELESGVENYGT